MKFLCEFSAGWSESGNEYRVFEVTDKAQLKKTITEFLETHEIGDPLRCKNERRDGLLKFTAVFVYEIASTESININAQVAEQEKERRNLYEQLRNKFEGEEQKRRLYEQLKALYAERPNE